MKVNSIQSSQTNFKGGMLFKDAKLLAKRPISDMSLIENVMINSRHVQDIRSVTDPFIKQDGFKSIISLVNGTLYAVKESLNACTYAWVIAGSHETDVVDVKDYE